MGSCERQVLLTNKMGLHARPSTQIATVAGKYACRVRILKDGMIVDAKSVLELLMLAAECGSQLTVQAEGEGAEAAVGELARLIESRFGELEVDR